MENEERKIDEFLDRLGIDLANQNEVQVSYIRSGTFLLLASHGWDVDKAVKDSQYWLIILKSKLNKK